MIARTITVMIMINLVALQEDLTFPLKRDTGESDLLLSTAIHKL